MSSDTMDILSVGLWYHDGAVRQHTGRALALSRRPSTPRRG